MHGSPRGCRFIQTNLHYNMKNLLLLLLAAQCCTSTLSAQNPPVDPYYHPFSDGPTIWSEEDGIWCTYTGHQYKLEGDTVVPGVGQGKMLFHRRTYTGSYPCPDAYAEVLHEDFQLIGLVEQDIPNKEVYFTRLTPDLSAFPVCFFTFGDDAYPLNERVLLYDFNIKVGDILPWRPVLNEVLAVDSILLNDGTRRQVYYFDLNNEYYWIEGIGSSFGFLNSRAYPALDINCGMLYCYRDSGLLKYNTVDAVFCDSVSVGTHQPATRVDLELYPNPTSGSVRLDVPADVVPALLRIFDAQGRLLGAQEISSAPALLDVKWLGSGANLLFLQLQSNDGRQGRAVLRVER